ncbi:tetratricopeptide repeat protein [Bremerella alba]|uniref:Beta-barrel assembly-enhancing protease n=1 Tax=Bremerella alba TaxID=980252 RepID=A0A7V8V5T1_9BACT|nr:hypothetical protein [Bremerella alba]MBA2115366.1 Beta-barrel assembly-enhancing protease [Bremerella alba]
MSPRPNATNKKTAASSPTEQWASQLVDRPQWLRVVLVVAVVAVYLTSLGGTFVFDDIPNIVEKENIADVTNALRSMMQLNTRATTQLSFALNAALFGKSAFYFHCVNLLVHVVSVVTLFELVRGSINWWNRNHTPYLNANLTGFFAALLWGVHPLGTMAVTYIVQRHESLMAMFYLLTLYCLLCGHLAEKAWPWYLASILCCWLGMGSKEVMVTVLLVALLYDRCVLAHSWRELFSKRGWVFAMYLLPSSILLVKSLSVFQRDAPAHDSVLGTHETASSWLYLWTQSGVIVHYLRLSIWPDHLAFDYDWPVASREGEYLLPAIIIFSLLVLSFWTVVKRPAIGFVAITFFFVLAPTSSIVPITDVAFEHRMYLPLACVCVLAVMGLVATIETWRPRQSKESKYQILFLIGLTIAVLLGTRTVYRNLDYHSQIALWTSTVESRPMNLRANHNLAKELRDADRLPEAEQFLLQSIAYCERYGYESFPLHGDLAEVYVYEGQFEQAYQRFQMAFEAAGSPPAKISEYRTLLRNRKLAETRTSFGALLDLLERPSEAAQQFDLAIELRPDVASWYAMAGHIYRKTGDLNTALVRWKRALDLDPTRVDVARDYTLLLIDAGHYAEATQRLQQSIQTHPEDLALQFQLARIQAAAPADEIRDPEASVIRCDQLISAFAQHAFEIQQVKAMALGNAGHTAEAIALLQSLRQQTTETQAEVRQNLDLLISRFQQDRQVFLPEPDAKR